MTQDNRFALLEMDPIPGSALPDWAVAAIGAIQALMAALTLATARAAHGQLEAIAAPLRAYPEGPGKVAVRAEIATAQAAARALLATAPVLPATATVIYECGRDNCPGTTGTAHLQSACPALVEAVEAPALVESDLASIVAESAANASVAALGSMAGGQLRGVGFSDAAGYVTALSHGVKLATADSYKATLRNQYGYTEAQIAALAVTIIPEAADLPNGPGIKHVPDGPSIFDKPKAQRGLQVGNSTAKVTGTSLLKAGDLIAGSIVGGAGGDFSWHGAGKIERAQLLSALAEIGRESAAPAAKSAHAQAGRAVNSLRSLGYHIHAVQGTERRTLPSWVKHRYIIGRAVVATGMQIGDEYGRRVLVIDLHDNDTLHCDGDAELTARVTADFEARCAADVYTSADLTTWLQWVLFDAHGASRFGVGWYVPHGQVAAAEQLTRAVAKIWGISWRHGMPVAACSHLFEGLTEGLVSAIETIEADWATAKQAAKDEHKLQPGTRKAGAVLRDLTELGERIRGYALLLGDDAVKPLRDRLGKLSDEVRPLVDDTSARAMMLEFS